MKTSHPAIPPRVNAARRKSLRSIMGCSARSSAAMKRPKERTAAAAKVSTKGDVHPSSVPRLKTRRTLTSAVDDVTTPAQSVLPP